ECVNGRSTGPLMQFVPVPARNGLFLYYKSNGERRKLNMFLPNESGSRNIFDVDYQGSEVANFLGDRSISIENVYIQPAGSVKTRIELPYLEMLVDSFGVAINRAEIYFDVIPGSTSDLYPLPDRMFLLPSDSLGFNSAQLMPD